MSANFCQNCGTPLQEGMLQCPGCGRIQGDFSASGLPSFPYADPQRPLGAWEFFGIRLLCGLPLIGVIFILIWAFDQSNINRRNLARSMVISYLISLALSVILSAVLIGFWRSLAQAMFTTSPFDVL